MPSPAPTDNADAEQDTKNSFAAVHLNTESGEGRARKTKVSPVP